MRKYNEGYALPFVLVVMTVLALIATSIMSISLRNLQSQRASVERMQERYTAEGAVEIVVARLTNETELTAFTGDSVEEALQNKIAAVCSGVYDEDNGESAIIPENTPQPASEEDTAIEFRYPFTLKSTSGSVQIICELELSGNISSTTLGGSTVSYAVDSPKIEYTSYRITTVETPTEGGGGNEG